VPAGAANYIKLGKNSFVVEWSVELSVRRGTANAASFNEISKKEAVR